MWTGGRKKTLIFYIIFPSCSQSSQFIIAFDRIESKKKTLNFFSLLLEQSSKKTLLRHTKRERERERAVHSNPMNGKSNSFLKHLMDRKQSKLFFFSLFLEKSNLIPIRIERDSSLVESPINFDQ
ncbi:hypothetical protein NH340_JMT00106 [Sarcoptes scabiei]|nr:hypothetical protein NH340_JMT00106 [Sarcoptes scabiei]